MCLEKCLDSKRHFYSARPSLERYLPNRPVWDSVGEAVPHRLLRGPVQHVSVHHHWPDGYPSLSEAKRRCSSEHPWVMDHFRDLIQRKQRVLLSGNQALYRFCRNRVNHASKYLRKAHYNQVVVSLASSSGQWWRDIREIAGLKQGSDNMGCPTNSLCGGDTQELGNQINAFLQSVSADFIPLTPDVKFTKTETIMCPTGLLRSDAKRAGFIRQGCLLSG